MSPQQKKPKEKPHSLQSVARRELGIGLDKEHQTANWGGELTPAMLKYSPRRVVRGSGYRPKQAAGARHNQRSRYPLARSVPYDHS